MKKGIILMSFLIMSLILKSQSFQENKEVSQKIIFQYSTMKFSPSPKRLHDALLSDNIVSRKLDSVLVLMKENKELILEVILYDDYDGASYRVSGWDRNYATAKRIINWLLRQGIDPQRINAFAPSQYVQLQDNETIAKNRRIEFVLNERK